MSITPKDMSNLKHMLGVGSHINKRNWGFRNHFLPGGTDIESMERLESEGFVCKGNLHNGSQVCFYHATLNGCLAAGLKPYQIRNAMER